MKYYKFLTDDNRGRYSKFDFSEYLPADGRPGKWLPEIDGELEICENGYHGCTSENLIEWLNAQLFEIEYMGKPENYDNKVNGRQIRFLRKIETWNERNARLFAVWCAREALKLIDDPDPRSVDACDVAERYANGNATDEELKAARDAARAAARGAARDAARAAARAAARDAARDAAWDVAWDVAWDAASYAARDAARDAACDAARYAVSYAARSAAWYAAWYAAEDAARDAQVKKLIEMLEEG